MTTFESFSSRSTKKFAESFARRVLAWGPARLASESVAGRRKKRRPPASQARALRAGATVIALRGELGSGKTTFVQGFMRGLGIKRQVTSPTFILIRRTALVRKKFKNVFHLDFYRIHRASELPITYLQEITKLPENILLVEWPERAGKMIPKYAIKINFHHGAHEHERTLRILGK